MQAYPFQHKDPTTGLTTISEGMTLRDYFAAQAMQAMAARFEASSRMLASSAYEVADAMLEARNVNN